MSIHSSLKLAGAAGGQRNVWTRTERIAALKKAGRWKEGDRVEGLRKVRTSFKVKAKKKADDGAAKPAAGGAAPAGGAAAPAAKAAAPAAKAAPAKK
ncbi:MAG: small basic protein [Planctomycetes bacterium]|nr:small basic protein [Planctomycetota bacterium]